MDTSILEYYNYNVDLNNTGLSFVLYASEDGGKFAVQPGLNRGFQMTGKLLLLLKDTAKFPEIEIVNFNQELTGAEALTTIGEYVKPKETKAKV
jgi:hypothetical protein